MIFSIPGNIACEVICVIVSIGSDFFTSFGDAEEPFFNVDAFFLALKKKKQCFF
jgi:hypothetical protein